ncbi:RNA polymerase, partial [Streptomyces sp. SID10244]|nr:RNA polymerase [Streptomyces sp. SID10244]
RLAREESGRVLALLAARFDDVDLADDCVQDALLQAAETWPTRGVPDNPPAWLYTVARNRIVDQLRLRASRRRRLSA